MPTLTSAAQIHAATAQSYDYILIGGGTSGCLLASRLADFPSRPSVLVLEAGRDAGLYPPTLVPGKFLAQLGADREALWTVLTAPQAELDGRRIDFLRGKQLGGSSAVNYMAMARGTRGDYAEWDRRVGGDGKGAWGWDSAVEIMKDVSLDWVMGRAVLTC
jgi:choline dehydrogenase-like flavoprotein